MDLNQPWKDQDHPSYHADKTEQCLCCRKPCAKSAWGPWCYACNVDRIERIDASLAKIERRL